MTIGSFAPSHSNTNPYEIETHRTVSMQYTAFRTYEVRAQSQPDSFSYRVPEANYAFTRLRTSHPIGVWFNFTYVILFGSITDIRG